MAFTFSQIVYSARLLQQLRTKLVFGQIAGRVQYVGQPVRGGSVSILTPGAITTSSTADGDITFNAADAAPTSILINGFTAFDQEILRSNRQGLSAEQEALLVANTIDQGAYAMAKDIDDDLVALASDATLDLGGFSDAIDATNILDVVGIVRDQLEAAGALAMGGWVVFPSAFGSFLFNALSLRPQLMDGSVRDGLVTQFMGVDIFTSPALTSSDAILDDAAHRIGG